MTIDDLVDMAERIHDAENWDLGGSSTRDTRNAFWARVIGCAYHGHATYNATPDRQWHLKKASADRPQTDDVATSLPTRNHWDCIPGAGADGYRFEATFHGPLPTDQIVYAPPKPDGAGPTPEPPQPPSGQPYPSEPEWWRPVFDAEAAKRYARVGRPYPDGPDSLTWSTRTAFDIGKGLTKEDALAKHMKALEQELGLS